MPPLPESFGTTPPVWVLAEYQGGHIQKVTFELLGDAKKLSGLKRTRAEIVLLCGPGQSARLIEELRPYEADAVHVVEHPVLQTYTTDGYLHALAPLLGAGSPFLFFIPATANGRDLAPRLAARSGMGYAPHCLTLKPMGVDRLEITRVTHGGGVHMQSAWATDRPLIATMKAGVADPPAPNPDAKECLVTPHAIEINAENIRVRVLEYIPADSRIQDLREAERIVSGGRGVGSAEGFRLIQDLADALHAAVGASRVVVDLGWVPYERQVGQTGKTVAPQLYVAVGISGASHHMMGMRGSEKVVAINLDKKAPIFSVAHFGVVGDLHQILPELTRRLRSRQKATTAGKDASPSQGLAWNRLQES